MANIGVVLLEDGEGSMLGVLETLVESAPWAVNVVGSGKDETSQALARASQLLALLVLSTMPYLMS